MIRFNNGTEFETLEVKGGFRFIKNASRDSIAFKITGSDYQSIKDNFINDNLFSVVEYQYEEIYDEDGNVIVDENGNPTYNIVEVVYPKDEYCIVGDITDHGDGTFTVFVGKKTEHELEVEALYAAVDELLLEVLA